MTIHRITSRRPSPSIVLSLVALFVALGGTSYAAVKINGKNIKQNRVTGKQVKERSLGTVPKARAADTAASATTAATATKAANADNATNATHAVTATKRVTPRPWAANRPPTSPARRRSRTSMRRPTRPSSPPARHAA